MSRSHQLTGLHYILKLSILVLGLSDRKTQYQYIGVPFKHVELFPTPPQATNHTTSNQNIQDMHKGVK